MLTRFSGFGEIFVAQLSPFTLFFSVFSPTHIFAGRFGVLALLKFPKNKRQPNGYPVSRRSVA
jgi:hypothetical protein